MIKNFTFLVFLLPAYFCQRAFNPYQFGEYDVTKGKISNGELSHHLYIWSPDDGKDFPLVYAVTGVAGKH